ncbi:MAG: hypothetical protein KAX19_10660 [Candidatus Brocadiae bacterium]|nr:hypothetical protein [Candidatus Brocadiia bacterium]
MAIKLAGYDFDGPTRLTDWEPPYRAGVYCICWRKKPDTEPSTYYPIYFGESSNLSERGFVSHHKRSCWIREAGSESKLYVCVHLMPNSTAEGRGRVEQECIAKHDGACND